MKDVEEIEKAKNIRRAAKSALTRAINSARTLIAATRPPNEVLETLKDVEKVHGHLVAKHEGYTMFLTDEEYEDAEIWMADCTDGFTRCGIEVMQYVDCFKKENSQVLERYRRAKEMHTDRAMLRYKSRLERKRTKKKTDQTKK